MSSSVASVLPYLAWKWIPQLCPLGFNSTNEITVAHKQLHLKEMFSYLTVKLSLISLHKIHCKSIPSSSGISLHLPLLSYHILKQHHSLQRSAAHIFLTAHWFSHTRPHMHRECRQQRFAHLTERCRISVRDLLMLLAILISSFSSESVYWASWSRLRAQSALLVSRSACTVCGKIRPRGQPLATVKGRRLPQSLNSCVSFTPPKSSDT